MYTVYTMESAEIFSMPRVANILLRGMTFHTLIDIYFSQLLTITSFQTARLSCVWETIWVFIQLITFSCQRIELRTLGLQYLSNHL